LRRAPGFRWPPDYGNDRDNGRGNGRGNRRRNGRGTRLSG